MSLLKGENVNGSRKSNQVSTETIQDLKLVEKIVRLGSQKQKKCNQIKYKQEKVIKNRNKGNFVKRVYV